MLRVCFDILYVIRHDRWLINHIRAILFDRLVSARVTCEPVCRHLSVYTHVLDLSPADLIYLTVPFYIQRFDFCCSEVDFLYVKLQGYFYSPAQASMFNVKSILYNVHIVHSTSPTRLLHASYWWNS